MPVKLRNIYIIEEVNLIRIIFTSDTTYQHMQRKDNIVLQRLVQESMRKLLQTCLKLKQ